MSTARRSASFQLQNNGGSTRRSPRRLRTKTPSVNELSKKYKMSPKGKRKLEFQNQREKVKPLQGKRFYLDLHNYRKTATLCENIKELGGTVEEFLSKDVTFVITNSKEVDQKCSPRSQSTPSPGMFNASPFMLNKSADSPQNVEQQQTVKKHTRGQAFVNQSLSQSLTHKVGSGNVLSNARTWGVTIVRLEKLLEGLSKYIKPGKNTSNKTLSSSNKTLSSKSLVVKVRKLQIPFIKVEDQSRHFKPLVHELKEWPKVYFNSPPGWCPFDPSQTKETKDEKVEALKVTKKQPKKDNGKLREKHQEPRNQKRGYCECCCIRYEDLDIHLKSEHHKSFARNSSNYNSLDQLIARGNSLEDFLNEIREENAVSKTPERSDQKVFPDSTSVFQTPVNSEHAASGDEKVTPRTRSQQRASSNGSPNDVNGKKDLKKKENFSHSGKIEKQDQGKQKEDKEQKDTFDPPARRTRSSNCTTPPEKQKESAKEEVDLNVSDESSGRCSQDHKTSEHSKNRRNNSSTRVSKKSKSVKSDGGSSKENCDPSPNQKQTKELKFQSQNTCKISQDVKKCSSAEVIETTKEARDGYLIDSEIKGQKSHKQQNQQVPDEKDDVAKDDDDEFDCVFETPGEVRDLLQLANLKTLTRKSSFNMNNKKKNNVEASNLEVQEKQNDTCSTRYNDKTKTERLNKDTLQSVSAGKDHKLSNPRRCTTRKHRQYIEQTSDETESIDISASDNSTQNLSPEEDVEDSASTSTITLPREDNLSDSNEVPLSRSCVEETGRYAVRKRSAGGGEKNQKERPKTAKPSESTKTSRKTNTVTNRKNKSLSVREHPHQTKKMLCQAKKGRSNSCLDEVNPEKKKTVDTLLAITPPSGPINENKTSDLTSSPSSGYCSPVFSKQRVGAKERQLVEEVKAAAEEAEETIVDSDVSLIALDGSFTVNNGPPHVQEEHKDSGKKSNERCLKTLFDSEDGKNEEEFYGFCDTEILSSTKKKLLINAKKNRINSSASKSQNDVSQSLGFSNIRLQQVPTFDLSEIDANVDTEQESFSVCINSLLDSIQVENKSAAPTTNCQSEQKETAEQLSRRKLSKPQKLDVGKQKMELNLKNKDSSDNNYNDDEDEGDCESVVYDSTGEESDDEVIEPIISPIRQHKRKSVNLSDEEIIYNFPTKRRKTLDSTSSISEWSDGPLFPAENQESVKTMESNKFSCETEFPKEIQISAEAYAVEVENKAVGIRKSTSSSQKTDLPISTDSEFDFNAWIERSFYVDITERVKLRGRKRLENVKKADAEKTMCTRLKPALSSQEQQKKCKKVGKNRSASVVENTGKSGTQVSKSKRYHSLGENVETSRATQNYLQPKMASVHVRKLRCPLSPLGEAQLMESSTWSLGSSSPQVPFMSTRCHDAPSIRKRSQRLHSTPCSARYPQRNLRNVRNRSES